MKILILGGTGYLGRELVKQLYALPERTITVFSRDEKKQAEMAKEFPGVKFVIGDVRSREAVVFAIQGQNHDCVIHLAAMKRIDTAEANPEECLETNVRGTINVVQSCLFNNVGKAILMSSDKAVEPNSVYGASKLAAEKTLLNGNHAAKTRFSVVRSGNIWGSDSSVIPYWTELAKKGEPLPLTDPRMERYFIKVEALAEFIIRKLETMRGGEIFIPPCRLRNMNEVAEGVIFNTPRCFDQSLIHNPAYVAIAKSPIIIVGLRPGEKLSEELMTAKERETCDTEYTIR